MVDGTGTPRAGRERAEAGDEPPEGDARGSVAAYFGAEIHRADESSLTVRVPCRRDLTDGAGGLRAGPVAYAADTATGIVSGLAVVDADRWVVTTDLDLHLAEPVTVGPLRVDAEVVRAGATTVVARFELCDEGLGRRVGAGTATGRPFPISFDPSMLSFPVGVRRTHGDGRDVGGEPIGRRLGFRRSTGGVVEVDLVERLRNGWGILHGGVTACLADEAAAAAAAEVLGTDARCSSLLCRYLAPGRVGPVVARARPVAVGGDRVVVEVEVRDLGQDDPDGAGRPVALVTAEAAALPSGPSGPG